MTPVIDALHVARHAVLQADICIIGAGAAGITIAKEFMGTPYQVLLLESGDFSYHEPTQALYKVENIGHPIRIDQGYVSRNRYFGGSTNTWAGRCMPLNEVDFQKRSWVKDSGWPFSKETLEPFYQRASEVLHLPSYQNFHPDRWRQKILKHQAGFLFNDSITTPDVALYAYSPLKMGIVYKQDLLQAGNIHVLTHANLTEIEPNPEQTVIRRLRITTLKGNDFWVKSQVYVLACGGWENARLLLLSRRYCSQGLGNLHDLVGRYYMEHPKINLGKIYPTSNVLRSPIFLDKIRTQNGFAQLGIRLTDQQQQQEQLLNHYIELSPGYPVGMPEASKAFQLTGSYLKRLKWAAIRTKNIKTFVPYLGKLSSHFIRKHLNQPIPYPYISILNHFEQAPNRESRVTLGRQRDVLGQNVLQVKLKVTHQDKESLVRLHTILDQHFQALGVGRLVSDIPDADNRWENLTDSSHHMGTTRMSDNPRQGVVDSHCKIHGFSNIFIASSSVFPTGGHANPTLTVVALALKLADHLKAIVLPAQRNSHTPGLTIAFSQPETTTTIVSKLQK
ncbi:MAG: GMC family oxidoreductase [Leptolyngbya sp. SIO1D8]|nr:GMC family oxidoreductase [Leptolyngbya sp. SIO1D8]